MLKVVPEVQHRWCNVAGVKFPLDKAVEATKKAMDGVGGQGKVMLEDMFDSIEE